MLAKIDPNLGPVFELLSKTVPKNVKKNKKVFLFIAKIDTNSKTVPKKVKKNNVKNLIFLWQKNIGSISKTVS